MNYIKTGFLMLLMSALLLAVGALLGQQSGLIIALVVALGLNFAMYWFGAKIALSFSRSKPMGQAEKNAWPWLFKANEELCAKAGIPVVPLYLSPDPQPNAFACGRGPGAAAISLNKGLIDSMSPNEVVGVLAHEIAHVRNRDTLIMTIAAAIGSAIMFVTRMAVFFGGENRPHPVVGILLLILGPLAALLIQMAVSRTREYAADAYAAYLMNDPNPLADALESLEKTVKAVPSRTADPATAHMYIANPLSGEGLATLFSTHPPIKERVRRLRTGEYKSSI